MSKNENVEPRRDFHDVHPHSIKPSQDGGKNLESPLSVSTASEYYSKCVEKSARKKK